MSKEKVYLVVGESFIQSVMSDVVTFGMIGASIWFSQGSKFWTFICFMMLVMHISCGAFKRVKGATSFRSKQQLLDWASKEEE
jgi:hypothetical protein